MADSSDSGGSAAPVADMKACPFCGENIKKVAVRCKHCQADLSKAPEADFTRGVASLTPEEFEVRFLEFAYQTTATINVPAVAHALKLPTNIVSERLEDMAARDVLVREIDDGGNVYFMIPGRPQRPPAHPPLATTQAPGALAIGGPAEGSAVAAMVLNVIIPGSGSLVAGRVSTGVAQMLLWVIGFPLCFVLVGFPMVMAAWVWSLVTGIHILEESRRRQQSLS
jgi:TM2 domain-containing membrane protein YozV